jgi:ribosome biogenesis GTPase / thiamine phosphate phosphatase
MEGDEGLRAAFEEIQALAVGCRFSDCRHEKEPGCAVREALSEGRLAPERLENYRKLTQEVSRPEYQREPQAQGRQRRAPKDAPKKRGR